MKQRVLSRTFLLLLSLLAFVGCSDDSEETGTATPTITSFTPASGTVGTTVTITGTNFSTTASANTVAFNGTSATVSAATATQLTVTVPSGATTGKITVTVGSNTATSTSDFTVNSTSSTAPTIASFTPSSGAAGTTVTITGTNFSTTVANNTVMVNGVSATVTAATATQLTITLPAGATTGTISVTVNGQTATSTAILTVTPANSNTSCASATTVAAKVACLADAFKATLTSAQVASVQIALTKANAIKWSNLPGGVSIRNGVEFSTLTTAQLEAANAVIAAAAGTTSDEGFSEFSQIRAADSYLGTIGGGSGYSSGKYIIAFLGTPSATGTWMLQFGGHHYAQNITFSNGQVVSITPSHQGVEPTSWTSNGLTYAPLKAEYDAMKAMLASLSTAELASARLSATFSDVLLGPNKDGQFPATKQGLAVSTLTTAQKQLVLNAMKPWLYDADDATAAAMLAIYENELNSTYIAYSGNTTLTANADYVRIDGPSVWIEFVCQSGVVVRGEIHYHTVFRDHTRDYNGL